VKPGSWQRDNKKDGEVKLLPPGEHVVMGPKVSIVNGEKGEPTVVVKKDKRSPKGDFKTIPLSDLDDTDIRIIDDPEVLRVYREEVDRGRAAKINMLH
jgi:hypothetical protein